jgi:hypothetical protein
VAAAVTAAAAVVVVVAAVVTAAAAVAVAAAEDAAAVTEPWLNAMFRHILCVNPYRRTRSSKTSFPPLGLEYVAALLRPHAERIDLVYFRQSTRAQYTTAP